MDDSPRRRGSTSTHSPLVVVGRSPQEHDDCEHGGEEQVPEGVVHPQFLPVLQPTSITACFSQ